MGREDAEKNAATEELIGEIASLAAAYTPEWRFDREHPDAGTTLALLFADMFGGTRQRFERIFEKHRILFFKQIGLRTKQAVNAQGYVTFGLSSDELGGTFLQKGIVVSGRAGGRAADKASGDAADRIRKQKEDVFYETTEALYVTPAELTKVLFVDGERDYIAEKHASGSFAPFERKEENLQEHVFYLCQSEVLSVSGGAEISLKMEAADDGDDGAALWLTDGEACSFFYSTADGFAEYGRRRMEGGGLILERDKEQENASRRTLFGKEGHWLCCRYKKPWLRAPFLVKGIRIASRREAMEPDFIRNQEGEQENDRVMPFGENPQLFAECYFASAEALGKPDAYVTVSFRIDYEKIPFDNSIKADRRWKMLMKRADFAPDPEYDITVAQVVWEYYNGAGWSRLATEKKWETLFDGTGARAGQQVRMRFRCPADAALLEWQAAPTRYLRVRVLKITNLYRPKGTYIVPVISGVRFSYDYEEKGKEPELVVSYNNLLLRMYETSKRRADQAVWELFCGQKEECPTLYFGFHRPLTNGPLRMLYVMREELPGVLPHLTISYSVLQGFAPLSVVDETESFRKSGALTFMGKEDFAKKTVCGSSAYWLRVQDKRGEYRIRERQGRMPRIMGIYMNVARVSVLSRQTAKPYGGDGNQEPGGITRLSGSYGYVNRVTNPLPIDGGCNAEEAAEALRRGSAALGHGGRAVTASDFEALAREASRSVKKVRCYPNCNADGDHEPGAVTVALLLEEFLSGGMYFDLVRAQVKQYLSGRTNGNLSAQGRFFVVEPVFLEMDCYVEAVVLDMARAFEVQAEMESAAARFLHPLTGNYDGNGWEIGTVPNETQMANALKGVRGLGYIRFLRLTAYRNTGRGRIQVALGGRGRSVRAGTPGQNKERFMAPLPGKCQVVIRTE